MASTIRNAANYPLFAIGGTTPDVSGAMQDYYQQLTFELLTKTAIGFQAVENTLPIIFRGVIQPFSERQLALLPVGERAWSHFMLHSDPVLTLQVDDIVLWKGKQTRVAGRTDNALYGYVKYHLVQDWTGSDPVIGVNP